MSGVLPYVLQAPGRASELTAAATSGSSAALSRILTATCCWRHVPSRTCRYSTAAASADTAMGAGKCCAYLWQKRLGQQITPSVLACCRQWLLLQLAWQAQATSRWTCMWTPPFDELLAGCAAVLFAALTARMPQLCKGGLQGTRTFAGRAWGSMCLLLQTTVDICYMVQNAYLAKGARPHTPPQPQLLGLHHPHPRRAQGLGHAQPSAGTAAPAWQGGTWLQADACRGRWCARDDPCPCTSRSSSVRMLRLGPAELCLRVARQPCQPWPLPWPRHRGLTAPVAAPEGAGLLTVPWG